MHYAIIYERKIRRNIMNYEQIKQAADYIRAKIPAVPEVCIILGSGLGSLADIAENKTIIPYTDIPGFPVSTVKGHESNLVCGKIGSTNVVLMQGRFHYYEGYTMQEVVYPVFVMKMLGVHKIIVTNACGALNRSFTPGDLMIITDHINFSGLNPLFGPNDERFGPRFPDLSEPYAKQLRELAASKAEELGLKYQEGVYAFYPGPNFETAAEIHAFGVLGADVVGMSTVPETIAANYLDMQVLGIA